MKDQVSIRIWNGCTVVALFTVFEGGYTAQGAVGGAGNSSPVDVELDPWNNLIVDRRVKWPFPVSIREEPEQEKDDAPDEG